MTKLFFSLGLWNWVLIGFTLMFLELLLPSIFFILHGLAAFLTLIVTVLTESYTPFSFIGNWKGQIVLFLTFSVALFFLARSLLSHTKRAIDIPFLNQRTDAMIGSTITLLEPIKDHHGYIHFNDTIWRATGPDMPKGSKARIIGFRNGAFELDEDNNS